MDKKTLKALKTSIKHWEENVELAKQGGMLKLGPAECALCQVFYDKPCCEGCPIAAKTGSYGCLRTPYQDVCNDVDFRINPLENCKRELAFLKSLLPK